MSREPYKKVLIVCEGEKTEPSYFKELINHFSLSTANVVISGDCGSAPINVVRHGKVLYDASAKDKYDFVYFVFDRDTHPTYGEAVARVSSLKPAGCFVVADSNPSFEYWFRLHFGFSRKPYMASGKNSSGDLVVRDLVSVWPEYCKNMVGTFRHLLPNLSGALKNAEAASKDADNTGQPNPSTKVHQLVRLLQELKGTPA
nr:RloB family protein [Luteibacter rhizovicinus]